MEDQPHIIFQEVEAIEMISGKVYFIRSSEIIYSGVWRKTDSSIINNINISPIVSSELFSHGSGHTF